MKVFIHYEEPAAESLRQTLKITLPKKWEMGPCSNLMDTFIKSYNAKHPENQMVSSQYRLETEMRQVLQPHTTVCEKVHDRADLYVKFGSAPAAPKPMQTVNNDMLDPLDRCRACKLFGCNKKYTERANSDDACRHHTKPPVFHETAKYWSCCPQKKAYDWESFMQIKGCATGRHSDIKPGAAAPLGGSHVRGQTASDPKLKKIEDFNSGKTDEKPLDLLKRALVAIGCSADDFDAAKAKLSEKFKDDEKEIQAEFCAEIGFGLHNLIGTTQPATGGPDPYGGPPQFKPPPNFAP
jgi:hypothetical protein